ncbi:hypothetical protein ACLMJK_004519 [Lecanora helva]
MDHLHFGVSWVAKAALAVLGVLGTYTAVQVTGVVPYNLPNPSHPFYRLQHALRQPVIAPKPPKAVQVVVHVPPLVELKQRTPVVGMNWSQDLYEDPGFDTANYTMNDIHKIQDVSAWGRKIQIFSFLNTSSLDPLIEPPTFEKCRHRHSHEDSTLPFSPPLFVRYFFRAAAVVMLCNDHVIFTAHIVDTKIYLALFAITAILVGFEMTNIGRETANLISQMCSLRLVSKSTLIDAAYQLLSSAHLAQAHETEIENLKSLNESIVTTAAAQNLTYQRQLNDLKESTNRAAEKARRELTAAKQTNENFAREAQTARQEAESAKEATGIARQAEAEARAEAARAMNDLMASQPEAPTAPHTIRAARKAEQEGEEARRAAAEAREEARDAQRRIDALEKELEKSKFSDAANLKCIGRMRENIQEARERWEQELNKLQTANQILQGANDAQEELQQAYDDTRRRNNFLEPANRVLQARAERLQDRVRALEQDKDGIEVECVRMRTQLEIKTRQLVDQTEKTDSLRRSLQIALADHHPSFSATLAEDEVKSSESLSEQDYEAQEPHIKLPSAEPDEEEIRETLPTPPAPSPPSTSEGDPDPRLHSLPVSTASSDEAGDEDDDLGFRILGASRGGMAQPPRLPQPRTRRRQRRRRGSGSGRSLSLERTWLAPFGPAGDGGRSA